MVETIYISEKSILKENKAWGLEILVKWGKKKKLLKIQEDIFAIRASMDEVNKLKEKRDKEFREVVESLDRLCKEDLFESLDEQKKVAAEKYGVAWTDELSFQWLMQVFKSLVDQA